MMVNYRYEPARIEERHDAYAADRAGGDVVTDETTAGAGEVMIARADRTRFRQLHESGCFVMPNAWDGASAKVLAACGFQAIATTSSGHAFTLGRADQQVVG